jgi:hypothetical protein
MGVVLAAIVAGILVGMLLVHLLLTPHQPSP